MRRARRAAGGFTLIEITIAIVILSFALITLLGLQSSSVERTIRDRNKQKAMLLARNILALIEIRQEPMEIGEINGTVKDVLAKLEIDVPEGQDKEPDFSSYQAEVKVDNWEIPGLEENPLRRVFVRVFWGPDPRDSLEVVYFVPIVERDNN